MAWSWKGISSNGPAMHLKPGAGEERTPQSAKPIRLTFFECANYSQEKQTNPLPSESLHSISKDRQERNN